MSVRSISQLSRLACAELRYIFTDLDDTLTVGGKLPPETYQSLWRASRAGIDVIVVTGRPAGWCDHLARMWPVAAVVGENGALAFSCGANGVMRRIYAPRIADAADKLRAIQAQVLATVPGCKVSADQAYREYDLAIDFSEEVAALDDAAINRIVQIFVEHGATAKVSSIHVNGWFGDYDKLSMCRRCCAELLGVSTERCSGSFANSLFVGDSPNDEPMFQHFETSVGVFNLMRMLSRLTYKPTYLTTAEGGYGFVELVDHVLANRL